MKPTLYRYRDTESVIRALDGYSPGAGWEPLYSQAQFDQLQAQLVRQQASYEAEIKVEIDAALERAAEVCDRAEISAWEQWKATGNPHNEGVSDGASSLARDIRALKEKE